MLLAALLAGCCTLPDKIALGVPTMGIYNYYCALEEDAAAEAAWEQTATPAQLEQRRQQRMLEGRLMLESLAAQQQRRDDERRWQEFLDTQRRSATSRCHTSCRRLYSDVLCDTTCD